MEKRTLQAENGVEAVNHPCANGSIKTGNPQRPCNTHYEDVGANQQAQTHTPKPMSPRTFFARRVYAPAGKATTNARARPVAAINARLKRRDCVFYILNMFHYRTVAQRDRQ